MLIAIFGFFYEATGQCTPVIATNPAITQGCDVFTVKFNDNSACIIQQRLWVFGDGTTSSVQNPSHSFSAGLSGDTTYNVELKLQDVLGVWHSASKLVTVFAKPKVSLNTSKTTVCAIVDSILFTNTSSMPAGYSASWDFGDGSALSALNSVYHKYNTPGIYVAKLTVTNTNGCSKTTQTNITVNEIPNPDFKLSSVVGCNPMSVTFTNTTITGTFPISSWSWDFGGISTSTVQQPAAPVIFNNAGTFPVSLTATNTAGCVNKTINNVFVNPTPTATFTQGAKVCNLDTTEVVYTGTGNLSATYTWDFDHAQSASGAGQGPYQVSWNTSGNKVVKLDVDQAGCKSSYSRPIYVAPLPVVELSTNDVNDSICEEQRITFTALPDSFVSYQFYNLGNLMQDSYSNSFSISTLNTPNLIIVTATDTNGCASVASNSKNVTILPRPLTTLVSSQDSICAGSPVTFTATPGYDAYLFMDEFVELTDQSANVFNTSLLTENASISVSAINNGCVGPPSNIVDIAVKEPLNTPELNCGLSTNSKVTFIWDTDPKMLSYEISVNSAPFVATFFDSQFEVGGLNPGDTVRAKIYGIGPQPCGNTLVSDEIFCIAKPCDSIDFTKDFKTFYCQGAPVDLSIKNIHSPSSHYGISWDNGLYDNKATYSFFASVDRSVLVRVIDSTQLACPAVAKTISIKIRSNPSIDLQPEKFNVCQFDPMIVSSGIPGYDSYKFYVNDTLKQDSSYHKLSTTNVYPGLNVVRVKVSNRGCEASDTVDVNVVKKITPVFTPLSDSVCKGSVMTYNVGGGFDYYKFNRTGFSRVLRDSTLNYYSSAIENRVTVVATDAFGCKSYPASAQVVQKALPVVSFKSLPAADSLCSGDTISLVFAPSNYVRYEFWDNYYLEQNSSSNIYQVSDIENNHAYYGRAFNNGCYSRYTDSLYFKVREKLPQPVANCGLTGSGQMQFTWDAIASSKGYTVSVNGTAFKTPSTGNFGLSHIVSGLNPLDTVCLKVIAKGNEPCGNSIASLSACCVMPCAPVTFSQSMTEKYFCKGEAVSLSIANISSPSGRYLISWNGGVGGNIKRQDFVALKDTVVTVAVWDTTQVECTPTIKYFTIHVTPPPTVTLQGQNDFCSNESIVLKAVPEYYDNYQFYDRFLPIASGMSPTQIDQNIQDGHFYTVVSTYKGCKDTSDRHYIHVHQQPEIPDVFCGTTTTSSIEFRWDSVPMAAGYEISVNGFPFQTASSGITGLLHFKNGLSDGDSLNAVVRAIGNTPCQYSELSKRVTCYAKNCGLIGYKKTADQKICGGDQVNLSVSGLNTPSAKYAISWNGGLTYAKIPTYSNKIYSDSTISIVVIDSTQLSCPANKKDIVINVQPIPSLNLVSNVGSDSVCQGEPLQLQSDVIGYDGYKFFIDDVLVQDSLFYAYSTSTLSVGNHEIKVNSSYNTCYFLSDSTIFNVVSFPQLSMSSSDANDSICAGSQVTFKGSKGFENYRFFVNGVLQQNSADSLYFPSSLQDGDEVYCVATNRNLCSRYSDTILNTVVPVPSFTLQSTDNTICNHDTLAFSVSPSSDWLVIYNHGDSLAKVSGSFFSIDTLESSDLILVLGSLKGCVDTSNAVQTAVEYTPTASVNKDSLSVCIGDKVKLSVTGGVSYLWSNGSTDSSAVYFPVSTSFIWASAATGNCTSRKDSVYIFVDEVVPVADAGSDVQICRYDSIQLFAQGGTNYRWLTADSISNALIADPFVHPTTPTKYFVEVSNSVCRDTAEVFVNVDKCLVDLDDKIIEIFTPNEDGKNDFFVIDDIDYFTKNTLTVYNRWSNVVYTSSPYNNEWEGTNNEGANLPDGTYFIVLDLGNGRPAYTGFVMIQR
ncbi:MAG: PKD domain-containing protein [Flavobacteriales bacterium]